MFMVTLPNNPPNKDIFQIQALFFIKIRVKVYKTTGPSRYHACQSFGHSSAHFNHAARWVKFGEHHPSKDLKKIPE